MPVEIFTKAEFEQALPANWYEVGFGQGEWVYHLPIVKGEIEIEIRSSVGANNQSADTGQDSIRCWLVNGDGRPLGNKINRWTTRLPGWDKRLLDILRKLWVMAQWAGYCTECQVPMNVFKVRKSGPNKGKIFANCPKCKDCFKWMEE